MANQTNAGKSIERLSSGLRINRAGDDAAGLAISEKMRGQIRGLTQAARNAQDAISLIQTAEGALNETHAILQRMRELAAQSASDTNTGIDREEIQKEIDQLSAELTRIANSTYTVVDDTHVLVAAGAYGLVNESGDLVGYSTDGTAWTTLAGDALFTSVTDLGTAGQQITVSSDGGIDVSSQAAADAAITIIQKAIDTVSAERSMLGALQNRLEHTIANLGTSAENLQAAESRIRDVDMAAEMMAFTKFQILQQASTAMLAQANLAPQSVLQLLG